MGQITTHILDTALGKPATAVPVALYQQEGDSWSLLASTTTNSDGRAPELLDDSAVLAAGTYRMAFDTAAYLQACGLPVFYPWVDIVFTIDGDGQHYHIPLLLSPYGYSTYRGS